MNIANVSRETSEKLDLYIRELRMWNEKINLISRNTSEQELINDHILDSLQITEYLKSIKSNIVDFGSGGGLPGMVLAISGYENCVLTELQTKKCIFLKHVKNALKLKVEIFEGDVRHYHGKVDYITSRAVCSLKEIMEHCEHLVSGNTKYLLHKSKIQSEVELEEIKKIWSYDLIIHDNKYKTNGVILEMSKVKRLR